MSKKNIWYEDPSCYTIGIDSINTSSATNVTDIFVSGNTNITSIDDNSNVWHSMREERRRLDFEEYMHYVKKHGAYFEEFNYGLPFIIPRKKKKLSEYNGQALQKR